MSAHITRRRRRWAKAKEPGTWSATTIATSSASTSAPCPAGPSSSGSATAPSSAPRSTTTPTASSTRVLPGSGTPLPPGLGAAGARRLRRRAAHRRARRRRGRRHRPGRRHRHRHRLHRLHDGADRSPTAPRCASADELARPAARLRQAVEAPRRPGPGRPHQRARPRARRGVAAPLRRPDLLGVGVRQGPAAARGGPRASTPRWSTGSRPPTGSSGSCAARYVRNACTAGYKGIRQDGAYPSRDFLAALNPGFARFVDDKLDHADRRSSATGPAASRAEAAGLDRPARGHRRRGRQRRRPRHRPRPRRPSRPARWSRSWAPPPATS